MTIRFDTLPNGYDRTLQDDQTTPRRGDWQVIFKSIVAGREVDYSRETRPGTITREEIVTWTERQMRWPVP